MIVLLIINDCKIENGDGSGSFISSFVDLEFNIIYYVWVYVINSVGIGYGNMVLFMILEESNVGSFIDFCDGYVYLIVIIGDQVWIVENLAYLLMVNRLVDGLEDEEGLYYYIYGYNGIDIDEVKVIFNYIFYGVFYNWIVVMNGVISSSINLSEVQGVCFIGWYLLSDEEWIELVDYLGGYVVVGGKLKEMGNVYWVGDNSILINEIGFIVCLGGYCSIDGEFWNVGEIGWWWSVIEKYFYFVY